MSASALPSVVGDEVTILCSERSGSSFRRRGFRFRFRIRFGLRLRLGFFGGEARVHLGGFARVNLAVMFVGLCQFVFIEQQAAETVGIAQLKLSVHLDRFKWT